MREIRVNIGDLKWRIDNVKLVNPNGAHNDENKMVRSNTFGVDLVLKK